MVVLHGLGVSIHDLEDAELAHAVEDGADEGEEVREHQEVDLGPHEALLRLVAPLHEDAILARGAEAAAAENEQVSIDEAAHGDPMVQYIAEYRIA